MERFQNESLFKTSSVDPYTLSHPLPRERISNLTEAVKGSSTYGVVDSPALRSSSTTRSVGMWK